MKIETNDNKIQGIEIVDQKQIKKELKFLGSLIKKPGLTLFEFNLKTFSLEKAKYHFDKNLELDFKNYHNSLTKNKVIINDDCIYLQALNIKNAKKVLLRDYKIDYDRIK